MNRTLVSIGLIIGTLFFTACAQLPFVVADSTTITLNRDITYQTITGWEAVADIGQFDFPNDFPAWQQEVLDLAIDDLGINRLRLGIRSGSENPEDYFTPYIEGAADFDRFVATRYEIVNDNDDPFSINWDGFNFEELDHKMDNVILPLKERLEARGEKLHLNLNYVDFESSDFEHYNHPGEYAEFILANFVHMQDKYGITPDTVEIILEPDNAHGWSATQLGEALVATANRLRDNGFEPEFIAPSTKTMGEAINYFDEMAKIPGVLENLDEYSYHRYGLPTDSNLKKISERAREHNLRTAMLERIGSDYKDLYSDLTIGGISAWEQFVLAYPFEDNGAQYYTVDRSNPDNPIVSAGSRTRYLRQYFKYIRAGAERIEAESSGVGFDTVAFVNENGSYVVVVNADNAGEINVQGLPNGTYGISYATETNEQVNPNDIELGSSATLTTAIPAEGVITIYGK